MDSVKGAGSEHGVESGHTVTDVQIKRLNQVYLGKFLEAALH